MTVTYSGDPSATPLDEVRFIVGDTDCTLGNALLQNEEIEFRLDSESSTQRAAWKSCIDIIAKLTPLAADWSTGSASQSKSQLLENYRKLERELRTGRQPVALTAGGISVTEKQANEEATDTVQGQIRSNQFGNPRTGDTNAPSSIRETFE